MNMHVWIIMGLTMVTAGGIVHVFIYPYLSGDINAEKRQAALRPMAAKRGAERQADAASRGSGSEKKMKGKIKAMSGEAKASAYIIGSLPPIVAVMTYLTSPKYIELLWTTQTGELVLGGCAVWMGIGIFVMKKMIHFDI